MRPFHLTLVLGMAAATLGAAQPAPYDLVLKNGRIVEASSNTIKGSPQEPMAAEELEAKLSGCLRFGLGATAGEVEKLAATIRQLEEVDDVGAAIVGAFPAN